MKTIGILLLVFTIHSCAEAPVSEIKANHPETIQPEKTPADYARDYCDCMLGQEKTYETCKQIIEEAQEKFGADNKEAEKEFSEVMQNCM